MADVIFNEGKRRILDGTISFLAGDIKVSLHTSSYVPDQDTDHSYADLTNELAGSGYTAGGESLTTKVGVTDDTNNRGTVDADDVTWSSITAGTAALFVIYLNSGVDATSYLICSIDSATGLPVVTNGGDLTIQWNADGILALS